MAVSLTVAVLITFCVALLPVVSGQGCPGGWSKWGDACWRRGPDHRSFWSANSWCVSQGALLGKIRSYQENNFAYGIAGGHGQWTYIGATDQASEGTWLYTDGTPLQFDGWANWEPNNSGNEDCAHLWGYPQRQLRGTWNDIPCGRSMAYLCSKTAGCPKGQYSPSASSSSCSNCPAGRYGDEAYVVGVSKCKQCRAGRYEDRSGTTNPDCRNTCNPGYYCPEGSGSATYAKCNAGYYGASRGQKTATCQGVCSAGYYCPAGSTTPTPSSYRCAAGRYGSVGQVNNQCSGQCSPGYYCSTGSPSATQYPCGGDHVYCPKGSSGPVAVPDGKYSVGEAGARSDVVLCEAGHWCRQGHKFPCPPGRYGASTGLSQSLCSGVCAAGYFCPAGSISATQSQCAAGANAAAYYCPSGTRSPIKVGNRFPLGIAAYRVADSQISASTFCCGDHHHPRWGRLWSYAAGAEWGHTHIGAWAAAYNRWGEWWQVDLQKAVQVDAVGIQQRECRYCTWTGRQGVYKFKVLYSSNCASWTWVGGGTEFTGNSPSGDYDQVGLGTFGAVSARCVRVYASSWFGHISVRHEVYGPGNANMYTTPEDQPAGSRSGAVACPSGYACSGGVRRPNIEWSAPCSNSPVDATVSENSNYGAVGQYVATANVAGRSISYSVSTLARVPRSGRGSCPSGNPFRVDGAGRVSLNNVVVDYESCTSFEVAVDANDGHGSQRCVLVVAVVNANDKPSLSDATREIEEGSDVNDPVGGALQGYDPDTEQTLIYTIQSGDPEGLFKIGKCSGQLMVAKAELDYDDPSKRQYVLVVRVTDDGATPAFDEASITINILNKNEPPFFPLEQYDLSIDENVEVGALPTPNMIRATEPDGDAVTYTLTRRDTPVAWALNSNTGQLSVSSAVLDYEAKSLYILKVRASDPEGLFAEVEVHITLNNVNDPPTMAPKEFFVDEDALAGEQLGVMTAVDADAGAGDSIEFSIEDGNPGDIFAINADSGQLSVASATLDYETTQSYRLKIKAEDSGTPPAAVEAYANIFVRDVNEKPSISPQSFDVDENAAEGSLVGTVTATDPDGGQSKLFSFTAGDIPWFTVDTLSGQVRVKQAGIDFEGRGGEAFSLTCRVTDSGSPAESAETTVTININDIDEPPVFQPAVGWEVAEDVSPDQIIGTIAASDPEGSSLTFELTSGNTLASLRLTDTVLAVRSYGSGNDVYTVLDHETVPRFDLRVTISDGDNTVVMPIEVLITDVNEKPQFDDGERSVAENAGVDGRVGAPFRAVDPEGQQLQYTIADGNDDDVFKVDDETGQVLVKTANVMHHATTPSYSLTMKATDPGPGNLFDTATLTIHVIDNNQAPVVQARTFTVDEDAGEGAEIGQATATDPDEGQTIKWSISGGESQFLIHATSGWITVRTTGVFDFESRPQYDLIVKATDDGKPDPLSSEGTMTIVVADVNEKPSIEDQSREVVEGAAPGTLVGLPIVATDPDTNNPAFNALTLSIESGNEDNYFSLGGDGQLRVVRAGLDYERRQSYKLKVRVTDPLDLYDDAEVLVSLIDVNDAPVLSDRTIVVDENLAVGLAVGLPLQATDDESNTQVLTYAISGPNCWGATTSSSAAPSWLGDTLQTYSEGSFVFRVSTGRYPILYFSEDSSIDVSYYKLLVGVQQATRRTKLLRCDAGAACRVKADLETNVEGLAFSEDTPLTFWVTATSTLRSGFVEPVWRIARSPRRFVREEGDVLTYGNGDDGSVSPALDDAARTMMAWVKSTDERGGIPLSFASSASAQCNLAFAVHLKSDNVDVLGGCAANDKVDILASGAAYEVHDGDWHHVAVVYDGPPSRAMRFYIDGVQSGQATAGQAYATKGGYTVGGWPDSNDFWDGDVRDARFYHDSLNAQAVKDAMNGLDFQSAFRVGTGSDPTDDTTVVADLEDAPTTRAPPVFSTVGVGSEAGSTAEFGSVCFEGTDPVSTDVVTLGAVTGALTVQGTLDYEKKQEYSFEVTVTDSGSPSLSDKAIVRVQLVDVNEPPVVEVMAECGDHPGYAACFQAPEDSPANTVLGRIVAEDQDAGQTVSLSMAPGSAGTPFKLDAATGVLTLLKPILNFESEENGVLSLTVIASDDYEKPEESRVLVRIAPIDVNEVPVLADSTRAVPENSDVDTTVGDPFVATDVDGGQWGELEYAITGGSGSAVFSIGDSTGQVAVAAAELDHEEVEEYTLVVTVTDGGDLSTSATLTIEVKDVNERPTLEDTAREIEENSPVGDVVGAPIVATDPDEGDTLLYEITGGNDDKIFRIGPCSGQIDIVTAALDHETQGVYELEVVVTDNGKDPARLSDTGIVTVTVLDVNEPPVISDVEFQIDENSDVDVNVGQPVEATDPDDGQTLEFSIVSGNIGSRFKIDPVSGQISVALDELDYETLSKYDLSVRATDDGDNPAPLFSEAVVTVRIVDINEAPVFEDQVLSVDENSPAFTRLSPGLVASDVDNGAVLTFSMVDGPTDFFDLEGVSVRVAEGAELDHETEASYSLTMRVTDEHGLFDDAEVTVSVNDVNERPVFSDTTVHVDENSPVGAAVGEPLGAIDVDDGQVLTYAFVTGAGIVRVEEFSFSQFVKGQLEVRQATLDHETQEEYVFQVEVSDNGSPQLSTIAAITVVVDDVNEPPVINTGLADGASPLAIPENVDCDDVDGETICNDVGSPLTADDPDGDAEVFWSITGGTGAELFTIVEATGQVQVAACPSWDTVSCLDYEVSALYTLQVTATDQHGAPSEHTFNVEILDQNEAPTLEDTSRNLPESVPVLEDNLKDRYVGEEIAATDPDAVDSLWYMIGPCDGRHGAEEERCDSDALTGNDDGMFEIDRDTGQLYLVNANTGRYIRGDVLDVVVMVTDKGDLTDFGTVSIEITDVNDRPTIEAETFPILENSEQGVVVTESLNIHDDDSDQEVGGTVTVELVKAEPPEGVAMFSVDPSSGKITYTADPAVRPLDHETVAEYRLYVTGTDDHPKPLTGSAWITIAVQDVNEAPAMRDWSVSVDENVGEAGSQFAVGSPLLGTDVDEGDAATLVYSLTTGSASSVTTPFSIDSATAQLFVAGGTLNFEDQQTYTFTVTATDTRGLSDSGTLTIRVLDINEAPVADDIAVEILENSALGVSPGQVIATDVDAADAATSRMTQLTYQVSDNDAFGIDTVGNIVVIGEVDYEAQSLYELTVTISDNGVNGPVLSVVVSATITIIDVNDVTIAGFSSELDPNAIGKLTPFHTGGGDIVYIHGSNFGPETVKSIGADDLPAISATYGPTATEYTAEDCEVCYFVDVLDAAGDPQRVTRCGTGRGITSLAQDNTMIMCEAAVGTGKGHRWRVVVNDNDRSAPQTNGGAGMATSTAVTSYLPPTIQSIANATAMPTYGNQLLTITGDNFGPARRTFVVLRYGPTESMGFSAQPNSCTVTVAHTEIQCYAAAGVGRGLQFNVEIDSQVSPAHSGDGLYAYAPPEVWYLAGNADMQSVGDEIVIVHGTNFGAKSGSAAGVGVAGLTGSVSVAYTNDDDQEYVASGCVVTVDHVEIKCHTSAGVGSGFRWHAVVGGQVSVEPSTAEDIPDGLWSVSSYIPPVITDISGPGAYGGATEGGQTITIAGEQFGPVSAPGDGVVTAWYGPAPQTEEETWRYLAAECFVSTAHVQITCKTVPGTGKDHSWVVVIGRQESEIFDAMTFYAPPVLMTFRGLGASDAQTPGDEVVIVEGKQFGPADPNPIDLVTYGIDGAEYVAQRCHVIVDHTVINCTTVQGAGSHLKWVVVIDGQPSGVPTTDYAAPSISNLTGPGSWDASTDGGEEVLIEGSNFGPPDDYLVATYGANGTYLEAVTYGPTGREYTAQECVVLSHTMIRCLTAPGVGDGLRWLVRVRGQPSALSDIRTRYAPPHVETLLPTTFATNGGALITLEGSDFGLADPTARQSIWFDGLDLPIEKPADGTRGSVSFVVPQGQGKNKTVVVAITASGGGITTSEPWVVHYESPVVDRVVPEKGQSDDSRHLVVEGSNFGLVGSVFIEAEVNGELVTQQVEPGLWSHDVIELDFNGKAGTLWVVVSGEVTNRVAFEHLAPLIGALCGTPDGQGPQFDTRGIETFQLRGENLGLDKDLINVTIGGRVCEMNSVRELTPAELIDPDCKVEPNLDVDGEASPVYELDCNVPAGQGRDVDVFVSFLGQSSKASTVSYLPPVVERVTPRTSPTSGGVEVTLEGRNFGTADVRVSVENAGFFTDCEHDHLVITCISAEGEGKDLVPTVDVFEAGNPGTGLQGWPQTASTNVPQELRFSYERPVIERVTDESAPAENGEGPQPVITTVPSHGSRIRIHGSNFGRSWGGNRPVVTLGGQFDCDVVDWSHDYIVCDMAEGEGTGLKLTVEVAGQTTVVAHDFGYERPVIDGIYPASGPTQGGVVVHIWGRNFGRGSRFGRAFLGDFSPNSTLTYVFNHTDIIFELPEGMGENLDVLVAAGNQFSPSGMHRFSYDPPQLYSARIVEDGLERPDTTTVGGAEIELTGTSLGNMNGEIVLNGGDSAAMMYPCGINCERYSAVVTLPSTQIIEHTHTRLRFWMPEGMGTNVWVRAVVGGRWSVGGRIELHYRAPDIQAVSPNKANSRGDRLAFVGSDFGETANQTIEIVVGGKPCLDVKYEVRQNEFNHPYVTCTSVADTVGYKNVSLVTAMQADWVDGECVDTTKCGMLFSQCEVGSYGQEGEWCLDCPRGANCEGELFEPVSVKGWWLQNGTADLCPDPDSEEARAIQSYVDATDRFYAGERPLRHVKVDEDDQPIEYLRVSELCADHPTECSKTWCTRIWRSEREAVPMAVPCDPPIACKGQNLCGRGYTGDRCASCDKCYKATPESECIRFRPLDSGECEQCPEFALLMMRIGGFVLLVIVLCIGGYVMNKYNIHLAFVSIGVDYFQILAIFRNSRVTWPPLIKDIFRFMAIFNLNLDIAAPECLFEVAYLQKWVFIEALPLCMAFVFCLAHLYLYVKKKFILRRRRGLMDHTAAFAASFLIMFYYLFLYLTRTILSIFNCAPTDPFDGFTYLQVGDKVEKCWEPGGLHLTLLPFAIIAFCLYTLGYPATVGAILFRNKELIMEDQLLRARGEGDKKMENPNAIHIRRRYHKVYYHFKPEYYYWVLAVLGRKFLIAFTALMFNRNPAFQLSCALLVIFCSYALQVKHKPYMSMADREEVLFEHQQKVADGDPLHERLAANIGAALKQGRKRTKGIGLQRSSAQKKAQYAAQQAANFLFNYNTVEAVLLFCASLVCLCGVMFESGRFESDYYQEQRDGITFFVLATILFSMVYFSVVFFSEVRATLCPKKLDKKQLAKSKSENKKKMTMMSGSMRSMAGGLEMTETTGAEDVKLNPMFTDEAMSPTHMRGGAGGGASTGSLDPAELLRSTRVPDAAQWNVMRSVFTNMVTENANLQQELVAAKKQVGVAEAAAAGQRARRAPGAGARRREFAPTRSGAVAGSNPAFGSGRSLKGSAAAAASAGAAPAAAVKKMKKKKKKKKTTGAATPTSP